MKRSYSQLFLGIVILLLISLFGLGCARSITEKSLQKTITFQVTFREKVNLNQYAYYFIFSQLSTPNITLPAINPGSPKYLPTPGRTYDNGNIQFLQDGGLQPLYTQYYRSWVDYAVCYNGTVSRYKSDGLGFKVSSNNLSIAADLGFRYNFENSGQTLTFSFDLTHIQYILPSLSDDDILYFKFASVAIKDGSESGTLIDTLDSNPFIPLKKRSELPGTEQSNALLPASADIISWKVSVR